LNPNTTQRTIPTIINQATSESPLIMMSVGHQAKTRAAYARSTTVRISPGSLVKGRRVGGGSSGDAIVAPKGWGSPARPIAPRSVFANKVTALIALHQRPPSRSEDATRGDRSYADVILHYGVPF